MLLNTSNILRSFESRSQLNSIESLVLLQSQEERLTEIYEAASRANTLINGNTISYINGIKINYTNICRARCKICTFYKHKSNPAAFALTSGQIIDRISSAIGVKEVTLQGGLNPQLTLDYHINLLKSIKSAFPNIIINAYTPTEVKFISVRSGKSIHDVLQKFKNAGLDTLCGTSAQILNDKIRRKIAQDKLKTAEWIDIIKTAHSLEIPTTASILVGHIEDEIYIAEHLDILKRLQTETHYFTYLEIIPFVSQFSQLSADRRVKRNNNISRLLSVCAVSRLFFGELIKNIHVSWSVAGIDTTMASLRAGINDIGYLSMDPVDIKNPSINGRASVPFSMLKSAVAKMGRVISERQPYQIKKPKYAIPATRYELETALV